MAVLAAVHHDLVRFPTRWAGEHAGRARCLLVLLLTLRGTPILYYGDELGMPQAEVSLALRRDPRPVGRDGCRTPMPWTPAPGAGFTGHDVTPWLPLADHRRISVLAQLGRRDSTLTLVRDLIALRRASPDLAYGDYTELPSPLGVWAFRRGRATSVVLNLSDEPAPIPLRRGRVVISTTRGWEGERLHNRAALAPWTAVVVRHDAAAP